ncbi:hypothetical protein PSEUDO8AS_90098 [Pseudomonas sp. 8AS]|nr:hypothetical protein PSEUDO8AS_90098 [Pseudomonas sp. 8AS]
MPCLTYFTALADWLAGSDCQQAGSGRRPALAGFPRRGVPGFYDRPVEGVLPKPLALCVTVTEPAKTGSVRPMPRTCTAMTGPGPSQGDVCLTTTLQAPRKLPANPSS